MSEETEQTSEEAPAATHDAEVFFYSSSYGMTASLAERLGFPSYQVKGSYRRKMGTPLIADRPYVLLVPTYRSERDHNYVPRSLKEFLLTGDNARLMRGVVGIGNINFGSDYNKGADVVSEKFGVPVLAKVELSGTPDEVVKVREKIVEVLYVDDDGVMPSVRDVNIVDDVSTVEDGGNRE